MERKSSGSSTPTPEKKPVTSMKDTDIVARGETGVHRSLDLRKEVGWIKDYVSRPFDPKLNWRDPPPTTEFGGRPISAEERHKAQRSTDLKIPGAFQWGLNPWYDTPCQLPSDEEVAKFEKVKEAALRSDFSSAYFWGMLIGAIPALLFVCGYLTGGRVTAIWFVLVGYIITSLLTGLVILPKLTGQWLQTETAKVYNNTAEPFISSFYYGFTVLGTMLIGMPLMFFTSIIMR